MEARLRRSSHERVLEVFLAIGALAICLAIDHALYIYIHVSTRQGLYIKL